MLFIPKFFVTISENTQNIDIQFPKCSQFSTLTVILCLKPCKFISYLSSSQFKPTKGICLDTENIHILSSFLTYPRCSIPPRSYLVKKKMNFFCAPEIVFLETRGISAFSVASGPPDLSTHCQEKLPTEQKTFVVHLFLQVRNSKLRSN